MLGDRFSFQTFLRIQFTLYDNLLQGHWEREQVDHGPTYLRGLW
jgi:hypothetical protein